MTNFSEARQRNAVSEGFALGLMMCGHDSLRIPNFTGTDVNLSIAYAWRHWEYSTRFPKVNTDFARFRTEGYIVMHATKWSRTQVFYWDGADVVSRSNWDWPEEFDDAAEFIDGDVPVQGWENLAAMFLARLHDPKSTPHLDN